MASADLNMLVALDALLQTESVAAAADQLRTSAPAMSRTLARLRRHFGDPLLVRAGRHLVPTPRALELRVSVHALVQQAHTLMTVPGPQSLAGANRTFAVQAGDMVLPDLIAPLSAALQREAPGATIRFLPDTLEGTSALRDGTVDIEIGVIDHADPETLSEPLITADVLGFAAAHHPLATAPVTVEALAEAQHLSVSRRGLARGPIDDRLATYGLSRHVVATAPTFAAALLALRGTELVCLAPASVDDTMLTGLGLATFPVPLDLPEASISMAWHPRNDADWAHQWLRERIRAIVKASRTPPPGTS